MTTTTIGAPLDTQGTTREPEAGAAFTTATVQSARRTSLQYLRTPQLPFALIGFTVADGKIVEVDVIADPDRIARLTPAALTSTDASSQVADRRDSAVTTGDWSPPVVSWASGLGPVQAE